MPCKIYVGAIFEGQPRPLDFVTYVASTGLEIAVISSRSERTLICYIGDKGQLMHFDRRTWVHQGLDVGFLINLDRSIYSQEELKEELKKKLKEYLTADGSMSERRAAIEHVLARWDNP
jgi:hypothetical protein